MKTSVNIIIISILLTLIESLAFSQSGRNKESIDGQASVYMEPIWGVQLDPRWKKGAVIGDVEDGITTEFVEFSFDGKYIVSANGQGIASVINVADGSIKQTFTYITDEDVDKLANDLVSGISGGRTKAFEVECGAFTPDGRFLVLGGNLNGIKVFNLETNSLVTHVKVDEEVDGLSISPEGSLFAYAAFKSAKVLGTKDWKLVKDVEYGKDSKGSVVNSICFTKDGSLMAICGNSGDVMLVNTKGWKTVGDGLIPDASSIKSVRFSPDERLIAAGNGGGEVTVWRALDMSLIWQYSSLNYVEAVAWSGDGRYLLVGGRDDGEGRILVFRVSDWQMVGNPQVMADGASIEYIDTYGDYVAVSGEDGHVRLYKIISK